MSCQGQNHANFGLFWGRFCRCAVDQGLDNPMGRDESRFNPFRAKWRGKSYPVRVLQNGSKVALDNAQNSLTYHGFHIGSPLRVALPGGL